MSRAAIFLLILGLLQMTGDLTQQAWLRVLGAISAAAPSPHLLSAVNGLETCSTRVFLEWSDRDGEIRSLELTPALHARLRGPCSRRHAYGAVLAYGPVLNADKRTRPMHSAVLHFALKGAAPLLPELGIDPADVRDPVRVRYQLREGRNPLNLPLVLEAP